MLHADSADISSPDKKLRGLEPHYGTTGSGGSVLRQCGIFLFSLLVAGTLSAAVIPKDSKVLGATKGKPIETGLVFVNGKYIEPPYVVQRWGCGIKINKEVVVAEAVAWADFVKTQSGAKAVKEATPAPAVAPAPQPVKEEEEDLDTSLDDLFDDDPKPRKKASAKPKAAPKSAAPAVTFKYEGEFVRNDAVKALINKVNIVRTEIDTQLRMGGFICFGDNYSRVSGDKATAFRILENVPNFQNTAASSTAFSARLRGAKMDYFPDALCEDLYRNRRDYRALLERRQKWLDQEKLQKMLDDVSSPTL